jgi:RNA polymerase sigma factor (sigma-70 family)
VLEFSEPIVEGRNAVSAPRTSAPAPIHYLDHIAHPPVGDRRAATATPLAIVEVRDDHGVFRDRLARWLASDTRVKIVPKSDVLSAVAGEAAGATGLVLLDVALPGDMLGDSSSLSSSSSTIHVLVVPADFDHEPVGPNQLEEPSADGLVSRLLRLAASASQQAKPARRHLSDREVHVLAQVAAGMSNKEIAKLLGISQKTVRNHLSRIFNKLRASNRTEAVMNAMRLGLPMI